MNTIVLSRLKHLPGKHNQQKHGRDGGGGSGSGSSAVGALLQSSDNAYQRIQSEVDALFARPENPDFFDGPDQDRFIKEFSAKFAEINPNDILDVNQVALGAMTYAKYTGLSLQESLDIVNANMHLYASSPRDAIYITAKSHIASAMFGKQFNEVAKQISNMNSQDQTELLNVLIQRTSGENPSANDVDMLAAVALYANPQIRMDAIHHLYTGTKLDTKKHARKVDNITIPYGIKLDNPLNNQFELVENLSLDLRVYDAFNDSVDAFTAPKILSINAAPNRSQYKPVNLQTADASSRFNNLMQRIFFAHTSQNTENILGAQIQNAMSQVALNADVNGIPSFFRPDIKSPASNPVVLDVLNQQYQNTQTRLNQANVADIQLYRGIAQNFKLGIPMSPWSTEMSVSAEFGTVLNQAQIPSKYIWATFQDPNFISRYDEKEHLVLESAFAQSMKQSATPTGTTTNSRGMNRPIYQWTEKNIRPTDISWISAYEPSYDIFYNFKTDETTKSYMQRLKHMPGKHNQKKHGRDGGGGSGGGSSAVGAFRAVEKQMSNLVAETTQAIHGAINDNDYTAVVPIQERYKNEFGPMWREQGKAISQMSDAEQNKLYDEIKSVWPPLDHQMYATAVSFSLYGNPDLRMRAARDLVGLDTDYINSEPDAVRRWERQQEVEKLKRPVFTGPTGSPVQEIKNPMDLYKPFMYLSIEKRLIDAEKMAQVVSKRNFPNATDEEMATHIAVETQNQFIRNFTSTHTSQRTDNIAGAMIQDTVAQVGPNAGKKLPSQFWPDGVKPPRPNPEIVQRLETEYRNTQFAFQLGAHDQNPALHRGSDGELYLKLARGEKLAFDTPMQPWSQERGVAENFAFTGKDNPVLRDGFVPVKYVLTSHLSTNWFTRYANEAEYLILGAFGQDYTPVMSIEDPDSFIPTTVATYNSNIVMTPINRSTTTKSYIQRLKHLPGKHNQGNHGKKRGGGGSASVGESVVIAAKKPDPRQTMMFDDADFKPSKATPEQEIADFWKGETGRDKAINDAIGELYNATEQLRIATEPYKSQPGFSMLTHPVAQDMYSKRNKIDDDVKREISKQQRERGVQVSKMSVEAQDALYESVKGQRTPDDLTNPRNSMTILALGLYGNPDLRMRIANDVFDDSDMMREVIMYYDEPTQPTFGKTILGTARDAYEKLSLEHRYALAKRRIDNGELPADVSLSDAFMQRFTYTHTTQTTTTSNKELETDYSVLGAQMQTAVSQVGPNRGLTPVRNYWPDGTQPPVPHPDIVSALNEQYDKYQQELRQQYPDGYIRLHRGEKLKPGQPYEPFSTKESTAKAFSQPGGYLRSVDVPIESVFTSHQYKNFNTIFPAENEYLILGTHLANTVQEVPIGTFVSGQIRDPDTGQYSDNVVPIMGTPPK